MTKIICPGHLLSARQSDLRHWHVERAYSTGYLDGMKTRKTTDPLDGFSNLTQAIQDGVRIDWEQLDGRKAKCVHPEIGTLTHYMVRDTAYPISASAGWIYSISEGREWVDAWGYVLQVAWDGENGWSLWVEGEIPVKNPTPDELEPGTAFRGEYLNGVCYDYIIYLDREGRKRAICLSTGVREDPSDIEVIEVYGIGTLHITKEEI